MDESDDIYQLERERARAAKIEASANRWFGRRADTLFGRRAARLVLDDQPTRAEVEYDVLRR